MKISTEELRESWISWMTTEDPDNYWHGIDEDEAVRQFDTWLMEYSAQIFSEGYNAAENYHIMVHNFVNGISKHNPGIPPNPYKKNEE